MLEDWLKTLEREKQKAISKIKATCKNEGIVDLATKEVKLNYITIKNFLTRISKSGFKVNNDLSRVDREYSGFEDYRRLYNHIAHHLFKMKSVPNRVEEKNFKAELSKYY